MEATMMVLAEVPEEYTSGKGKLVKSQVLTLIDRSKVQEHRLKQPLDYNLSDDEKERYAGKLADKTITVAITELSLFGSRWRCRGKIIQVEGAAVPPAGK